MEQLLEVLGNAVAGVKASVFQKPRHFLHLGKWLLEHQERRHCHQCHLQICPRAGRRVDASPGKSLSVGAAGGSATRAAAAAPGRHTVGRGCPPPAEPAPSAEPGGSRAPAPGSPGALRTSLRGPLGLQNHTGKWDSSGSFRHSPRWE